MAFKDPQKTKEYSAQWHARNKARLNERSKAWRAAHPEYYKNYGRAWEKAHPGYRTKRAITNAQREARRASAWQKAHPDRVRIRNREWDKAHPDLKKARAARRRARKAAAEGDHTAAEMENLFKQQGELCANPTCRVQMTKKPGLTNSAHADHIYPLKPRHPSVPQGSNYIENMQWLCQKCNCEKHAMNPIDWALERGILLPNDPKMTTKPKARKRKTPK